MSPPLRSFPIRPTSGQGTKREPEGPRNRDADQGLGPGRTGNCLWIAEEPLPDWRRARFSRNTAREQFAPQRARPGGRRRLQAANAMTGSELRALRRSRSSLPPRRLRQWGEGVHPDTVKYWGGRSRPVDLRGYAPKRMLRALGVERSSHNWSIQEQRADRVVFCALTRGGGGPGAWGGVFRPRGNLSPPLKGVEG